MHSVDIGNPPSIIVPPRRVPHCQRDTVKQEVEAMLDAEVIVHQNSPWTAPIVMVKKKDKTMRFCINNRRLNLVNKKDVFPLPKCDDIVEAMAGAAFLQSWISYRGYWQVEMEEGSEGRPHFQLWKVIFNLKGFHSD